MKKPLTFVACFAFFVSFAFSSSQEGYYSYSFARLSYIKGDVFIQRAEDLGYEEGTVNLPIVQGDKLGTREGRAEIHFGKKNYLRIDNYTQIDFVNLPKKGYDLVSFHLLSGNIFLRVNFLEREKDFEIHTPDASFYILEEGLYRFDLRENRETELLVYEGTVEAAGEEGSLLVRSEEKLIASSGHFHSDPVYFYASYDDGFSQWNRSRDTLHNRALARRYLPSELYEYEAELAYNGRWVYDRPYGYVWVPYVYHYEWRPYFYGRWVWYPIIGWNWVSYEPWGWCVYHYGRWHWRTGLGWYWIPTRIWGPAWVQWYWGYDYIGWSPLSYYGYPVVIVNNHFYGRYYNRYYPLNSRALTLIHKNQLQARHISKVALSQNQVTRLGRISLSAKQPGIKPVVNRAGVKSSVAAKVLSRSSGRQVGKVYGSRKALVSSSRVKSIGTKSSSVISNRKQSLSMNRTRSKETGKISNSKISSAAISEYSSRLSSKKSKISGHLSSSSSKIYGSRSTIKTYPSGQKPYNFSSSRSISSSSSKSGLSSSSSKQSYGSRSIHSYKSKPEISVKRYSSRSTYSPSKNRSSRSFVRQNSSYTGSSFRGSYSIRRRASSGNYTSSAGSWSRPSYSSKYRSYSSPSRSYSKIKHSSRNISSPGRKISSSKSYSSPRLSRPSSKSRVSRSSTHRYSSSASSSSKKIKRK